MPSNAHFRAQYLSELARLGLSEEWCPYAGLAADSSGALDQLLAHLRSLSPGATWRDVYPDMPAHWDLDDPDSWTVPYRALYPFDYQTLPAGPVCMVSCALGEPDALLDHVLADAARDGHRLYGAGFIPIENPEWPVREIRIVMHHATTEDERAAFHHWLERDPRVRFNGFSRGVGEI